MKFIRIDRDGKPDSHSFYDTTGARPKMFFKNLYDLENHMARAYGSILDYDVSDFVDRAIQTERGWAIPAPGLFGYPLPLTEGTARELLQHYYKINRYIQIWEGDWIEDIIRKEMWDTREPPALLVTSEGYLFVPKLLLHNWKINSEDIFWRHYDPKRREGNGGAVRALALWSNDANVPPQFWTGKIESKLGRFLNE